MEAFAPTEMCTGRQRHAGSVVPVNGAALIARETFQSGKADQMVLALNGVAV